MTHNRFINKQNFQILFYFLFRYCTFFLQIESCTVCIFIVNKERELNVCSHVDTTENLFIDWNILKRQLLSISSELCKCWRFLVGSLITTCPPIKMPFDGIRGCEAQVGLIACCIINSHSLKIFFQSSTLRYEPRFHCSKKFYRQLKQMFTCKTNPLPTAAELCVW